MNYLILIIVGILILYFMVGFIFGAINSKKRFKPNAKYLFDQLSEEEKNAVLKVWQSFQSGDVELANKTMLSLGSIEIAHIKEILNIQNRPANLSGGEVGDRTAWSVYFNKASERGFNNNVAEIIADVGFHGINDIMENKN